MRRNLDEYYKNYYADHGDEAYTMEGFGIMGRTLTLRDWLGKYVPKGGRVLDVGCGDGFLAKFIPEYEWYGIDLNLERAKDKPMKLVEQDLMHTPYPYEPKSFDAVICSEVLEHVHDPRIIHKEAKRLLKPKGAYLISTPNFDFFDHFLGNYRQLIFDPIYRWHFEHIRQYNYDSHKKLLNDVGFVIDDECGADAHVSGVFRPALDTLQVILKSAGIEVTPAEADKLIGRMFPRWSHTIMLAAKGI